MYYNFTQIIYEQYCRKLKIVFYLYLNSYYTVYYNKLFST